MRRAYIYARFSDEDKARNHTDRSIATQVAVCREYAKKNQIQVKAVFADEGKSGTSVKKRKGLQSLLERIKTFPVEFLLVLDIDRLARNTLDYLELKKIFKDAKVDVVSINQPMIDETPTGRMIEVFLAGGAEYFARMAGERTQRVLAEKAKMGYYPGGGSNTPIGYRVSKINRGGQVDTNHIFIPTIKSRYVTEAYRAYNEGATIGEVVKILNDGGLRTYRGNLINAKTANNILKNPFYAGKFYWGKKLYEGKHKAIISWGLWESVQKRTATKPHKRFKPRKYFYLLSGILFCGICRHQLWGETHNKKSGKVFRYYTCRKCRDKQYWLNCDIVEGWVRAWLQDISLDEATIDKIRSRASELLGERNAKDAQRYSDLVVERNKLRLGIEKVEDSMFLDGKNDDRLKETFDRYNSRLELVNTSIRILEGDSVKTLAILDNLIALAKSLGTVYDSLNEVKKQRLLRLLVHKIFVNPQGITDIDYQLPLVESRVQAGNNQSPPLELHEINKLAIKAINFAITNSKSIESLADFV